MEPLQISTARNLMVFMVAASDHVTGLAGLTLTITASKDGAAFASISPTVTDRGSGWYNVALTSSHTDTSGDFALHITGAAADPLDLVRPVEVERTGVVSDKTGFAIGVGGIASTAFASAAIDSAAIAANAIGASELAQDAAREIADEVLDRDLAGGASGGARNVRSALRPLRNKVAIAAGTATVYAEDDSTTAWTAAVTTAAGNPINSVDPA